eukprot:Pgem_evm1s4843
MEKSDMSQGLSSHDSIRSFGSSYHGNPKFRQGKRCCWGGMNIWVFIGMIVLIVACILAAILVPVMFIPVGASIAQSAVDHSEFYITEVYEITNFAEYIVQSLLPRPPNGNGPVPAEYVIIKASLQIRGVSKTSDGAILQPSQLNLYDKNGVRFGDVKLPAVTMTEGTTYITNQTVTIFMDTTNKTVIEVDYTGLGNVSAPAWYHTAVEALLYKDDESGQSKWFSTGNVVMDVDLAGTHMFYQAKLNDKEISFD